MAEDVFEAEVMMLDQGNSTDARVMALYGVVSGYVLPVLISAGLLTNLANMLVLAKLIRADKNKQSRQAQATTYRYLFWLALADFLVSVSLVVALVHLDREKLSFPWAFYYAHFENFLLNGLTSASVYIVVGMSVDRYIAVCHPSHYMRVSALRVATVRILMSFAVPVFLYLPEVFFVQVVAAEGSMWTYEPRPAVEANSFAHWWKLVVELCHRMFPSTILVILNACIIYSFNKTNARRREMTSGNKKLVSAQQSATSTNSKGGTGTKGGGEDSKNRQERRLVYLLVAVVVSFLVTTLPATVLALIDHDGASFGSFQFEVFRGVANCLEALGLSLNFVLYFTLVSAVREVLWAKAKLVKDVLTCSTSTNGVESLATHSTQV